MPPDPSTGRAGSRARDAVAGISVACVLVPQSLAYAQLAGFPAYRGLFAAAIPPLVAAPFASSSYLQAGPTAVSALLTFSALSTLAVPGSHEYVELGLLLALLVGLIRIAVGLVGAGVIAYLLSDSVLVGFVPGAAILIVCSQLPAVLGAHASGTNQVVRGASALLHPARWNLQAVAAAVAVAALLLLARRISPLVPAVLIAVGGAALVRRLTGFGGETIGRLHAHFPPITTSLPVHHTGQLALPAVVIAIVGFAEASSIARTYAVMDRTRWDSNREFLSQGVANLAASLSGGFPVGASFSRSALNRLAGAKTQFSALVAGLAVLAFLPFGSVLDSLPLSVLAATVVVAVIPLIDLRRMAEVARVSRVQFSISALAFVTTLALAPHVDRAVIASVCMSIVVHLWRELRVDVDARSFPDGRLELRPEGVLWFATASRLEDRLLEELAMRPEPSRLEIRLDGLGRIDFSGALVLRSLLADAAAAGLEVSLTGVPAHSRAVVDRALRARQAPAGTRPD
jgi:SulP family sulfate permease